MPTRGVSSIWMVLVLAIGACDDPAPVVLGRLQIRVRDAGERVDAGEHDHDRDERERAHDDDDDRADPSER